MIVIKLFNESLPSLSLQENSSLGPEVPPEEYLHFDDRRIIEEFIDRYYDLVIKLTLTDGDLVAKSVVESALAELAILFAVFSNREERQVELLLKPVSNLTATQQAFDEILSSWDTRATSD